MHRAWIAFKAHEGTRRAPPGPSRSSPAYKDGLGRDRRRAASPTAVHPGTREIVPVRSSGRSVGVRAAERVNEFETVAEQV
jgi:hypothetical protein